MNDLDQCTLGCHGTLVGNHYGESCGLAVEHSAHNRKAEGLIPVQSNARWKWCQSHARFMIAGAWSSSLMLQMIDNQ